MGINSEKDIEANLQIGPTTEGMVRLFVEADGGIEIPMDFDPEEAEEIAEDCAPPPLRHDGSGRFHRVSFEGQPQSTNPATPGSR